VPSGARFVPNGVGFLSKMLEAANDGTCLQALWSLGLPATFVGIRFCSKIQATLLYWMN